MPPQIPPPSPAEIEHRRRLGIDGKDEEWEGVYHVTPPPSLEHQSLLAGLLTFFTGLLPSRGGGLVVPDCGVFLSPKDYRVPDLVYVSSARSAVLAPEGVSRGAPDLVLEVLSPDDDTYRKFDFYARRGVPEVVVVEPGRRTVEVWTLRDGAYVAAPAGPAGERRSQAIEVTFRTAAGPPPRLRLRDARDPSRTVEL